MVTVNMAATGANIKNMMKARNIKVKDVQAVCGFGTPQAIFKWMRGDCMPTIDNMIIIADMCVYPNWYRSCTKNAVGEAGGGSRSRFARSGASIALAELTRNSPQDCFPGVNSLLRTLKCSRSAIGRGNRFKTYKV
jgi:hypothetical protein